MDLRGEASVGQLTNISTQAGTWTLYSSPGGNINFGASFQNVTQVFIADPSQAAGSSFNNVWDNLVLTTCDDNGPPSVSCPRMVHVECDEDSSGEVQLTVNLDDPDGDALTVEWYINNSLVQTDGPTTASSVSLTGTFPLGTSTVTVVVSDGELSATCSTTVTVVDTVAPLIMCAGDVVVGTNAGECFATLTLPEPGVSDHCDVVSLTNDAPAQFPHGTTTVTWTVTDIGGNSATCTQTVTVLDLELPLITCPPDITRDTDAGKCVATVALGSPVATDNCEVASITNDAPPVFPVGTTIVTWTATDESGNSATCIQLVTVEDNEAPVIECNAPATITPPATPISFTATATDNCGVYELGIMDIKCWRINGAGKRIDKSNSCRVEASGATVTIRNSGGVGHHISWTVIAVDVHGNVTEKVCTVVVVNPGQGKGVNK